MPQGVFPEKPSQETSKWKFVERLKYPRGRQAFYRYILIELKKRRRFVESQLGHMVKGQLEEWAQDMRETADKARENWPKAAEAIDKARQKVEELLEEAKKD